MMVRFYIADALIYPIEVTRESLKEGYYIPLIGGSLLYAYEEQEAIWMKSLQGSGGHLFGIEEEGKWASQAGEELLQALWPKGLTREQAMEESSVYTTVNIGSSSMAVRIAMSKDVLVEGAKGRLEPIEAVSRVGEAAVFKLAGLPAGHTFLVKASGAKVDVEGTEIKVTPLQYDEIIRVTVTVKSNNGDTYRLTSTLIPKAVEDTAVEAPVPVEAEEPQLETVETIEYETGIVKSEKILAELPTLKKVTHRRRGPRESEKLNAYLIGMRHELKRLDAKEKAVSLLMKKNVLNENMVVTKIEEERVVIANKPEGIKHVRLGIRCARVLSSTVKLNGTSLNSSNYQLDEHGIMILSDQFTARSGRLEVTMKYERANESPDRLSMDELKRRARRLEEKMCRVKEGIENG